MATEAFNSKELTLTSGKTLELVPLSIKNLRKFMRLWAEHIDFMRSLADIDPDERPSEADLTERQFDVYVAMATLGLEKVLKDDEEVKDIKEFIEDEVDEKSMYVILDVTGGLKLDKDDEDPNSPAGVSVQR